jgi:DNA-binding PadR family transcriptional regulator
LYLLKLLDEAPRHGYEVIRLLQDRFMGVYAPSPGTIYPRLARLEEDGLVTHEEVDGKKVYSITDKGREEIHSRLGDLADLEDELTESLRDVAREISVDVRDTVRSIREELASAAREFRVQDSAKAGKTGRAKTSDSPEDDQSADAETDASDEAQRIREEARRSRERMRADFREQRRPRGDWAGWSAWSEWASKDWGVGKDWGAGTDWGVGKERATRKDRTGGKDWAAAHGFASGDADGGGADTDENGTSRSRRGPNPFSDLERIAIQFANELRATAKQTGDIGERSLNDLRDILTDTLAKVRMEVFTDAGSRGKPGADTDAAESAPTAQDDSAPTAPAAPDDSAADKAGPPDNAEPGESGEVK